MFFAEQTIPKFNIYAESIEEVPMVRMCIFVTILLTRYTYTLCQGLVYCFEFFILINYKSNITISFEDFIKINNRFQIITNIQKY